MTGSNIVRGGSIVYIPITRIEIKALVVSLLTLVATIIYTYFTYDLADIAEGTFVLFRAEVSEAKKSSEQQGMEIQMNMMETAMKLQNGLKSNDLRTACYSRMIMGRMSYLALVNKYIPLTVLLFDSLNSKPGLRDECPREVFVDSTDLKQEEEMHDSLNRADAREIYLATNNSNENNSYNEEVWSAHKKVWHAVVISLPGDRIGRRQSQYFAQLVTTAINNHSSHSNKNLTAEIWKTKISDNYVVTLGSMSSKKRAIERVKIAKTTGIAADAFPQINRGWIQWHPPLALGRNNP